MQRRPECDAIIGCNPAIIPGVDFALYTPIGVTSRGANKICCKVGTTYPSSISLPEFEFLCANGITTKLPEIWVFDSRSRLRAIPLVVACVREDCLDILSALPSARWDRKDDVLNYMYVDTDLRIDRSISLVAYRHPSGDNLFYWLGDRQTETDLGTAWTRTLLGGFDQKWISQRDRIQQDPDETLKPLETFIWRAIFCADRRSEELKQGYLRLHAAYLQRQEAEDVENKFNCDLGPYMQLRTTWEDFYPKCEELRKQLMGEK